MQRSHPSRRGFLAASLGLTLEAAPASVEKPVVAIVKIRNGRIETAAEEAVELLGGIRAIARGRDRVLLKPNLVFAEPRATTKLPVVATLARLMKAAGKDVSIAEGSAAAPPFNVRGDEVFRTTRADLLDAMQRDVFDRLGYAALARSLHVPLINLHTGDLVEVKVPGAFVFERLTIHRALVETDLLCSIPMMKTHTLAGVTLGMKNLIGAYPGRIYQAVRGRMHDLASKVEPSGTAAAIVDIVRANKVGLTVIDGSTAMEGNGPSAGDLVPMETIVAGTNPLAADIVAARLMGFDAAEIPTFEWALRAGLRPGSLDDIEIRGATVASAQRKFARPAVVPWEAARRVWATREIG